MDFRNKLERLSLGPGRPFQLSLMFVGKAGAYPSEAPFWCSTLRHSPGITLKHWTRLDWKSLPRINTIL
jgi:hypothetical protein